MAVAVAVQLAAVAGSRMASLDHPKNSESGSGRWDRGGGDKDGRGSVEAVSADFIESLEKARGDTGTPAIPVMDEQVEEGDGSSKEARAAISRLSAGVPWATVDPEEVAPECYPEEREDTPRCRAGATDSSCSYGRSAKR